MQGFIVVIWLAFIIMLSGSNYNKQLSGVLQHMITHMHDWMQKKIMSHKIRFWYEKQDEYCELHTDLMFKMFLTTRQTIVLFIWLFI